jgi:hypothetical protein
MNPKLLSSLALSTAALALTYVACYQWLRLPKRVSAVIAFAFDLLTYLLDNPAVLFKI